MSLPTNCNPNKLRDAIAGVLDQTDQQELESHLETCKSCRLQLEQIAGEQSDWKKVSDYFLAQDVTTDPYMGESTVGIKLISNNGGIQYEVQEPVTSINHNSNDFLKPPSHPEMLGRMDGFEIEQMIGQGGMGVVYKSFDTELNRPVAIKVLADHLASNGVARQRFAREARAAAAVMHPNVVPIHSVNSNAQRPYIVMTLVSGRSLQAHVSKHGPFSVKDIIRIGKQIAAGLAAAHREGLVHRDIKPANILLEKDVSRVMITDFGLARAADDAAITQTGWLAGTPHYMSPEQVTGQEVDPRSDLFSLGSVLYFMATGREPFRAELPVAILQKISTEEPMVVRSINSDITVTISNLIEKLLSKNPDHRFQSAEEVEQTLTQYLAHLEQPKLQPKPKIKLIRKSYGIQKILNWLLGIVALIAATVWVTIALLPQPPVEQSLTWPEGLQTQEQWQTSIEQIRRDIEKVESFSPSLERSYDPLIDEQLELKKAIEQMENNLTR